MNAEQGQLVRQCFEIAYIRCRMQYKNKEVALSLPQSEIKAVAYACMCIRVYALHRCNTHILLPIRYANAAVL